MVLHRILYLCFAVDTLAGISAAQDLPAWDQGREQSEVRNRERAILETNHYLSQGDDFLDRGELASAASNYRKALNVVPEGPAAAGMRRLAKTRFSEVGTKYAEALIKEAEYNKASRVLKMILSEDVSPDYAPALKLQSDLADIEITNPEATREFRREVGKVESLLKEGDSMIGIGRFFDATEKFSEVLTIDRYNSAARRGLTRAAKYIHRYARAANDHARSEALKDVANRWEDDRGKNRRSNLSVDPTESDDFQIGGAQSEDIVRRLNSVIIDEITMEGLSPERAVAFVRAKAKEADPTGRGFNILLGSKDIEPIPVTLQMSDIPVIDVLQYVAGLMGARYRIETNAVILVPAGEEDSVYINRSFTVPPDFISTAPSGQAPDNPFEDAADDGGISIRRLSAEDFLAENGIAFPEGTFARYNPAQSKLSVRHNFETLQAIEHMVLASKTDTTMMVGVEVKILQITNDEFVESGFDWLAGDFVLDDRGVTADGEARQVVGGGGGVVPTEGAENTFAFRDPVTGTAYGGRRITESLRTGANVKVDPLDSIINNDRVSGVNGAIDTPGTFSLTGVMPNEQFQVVWRSLSQNTGADLMARPAVLTKNGQKARVEVVRELLYPSEWDPPELPQNVGASATGFPVTPANPTAFLERKLGLALDVNPVITADGSMVELSLQPEFVELEGFINYGSPIKTALPNDTALNPLLPPTTEVTLTENRIVFPVFKTIRSKNKVTVYDGHTIVLAALSNSTINTINDKIPILGDIPALGRFFRSNVDREFTRQVVVFVSIRVMDPGGNGIRNFRGAHKGILANPATSGE